MTTKSERADLRRQTCFLGPRLYPEEMQQSTALGKMRSKSKRLCISSDKSAFPLLWQQSTFFFLPSFSSIKSLIPYVYVTRLQPSFLTSAVFFFSSLLPLWAFRVDFTSRVNHFTASLYLPLLLSTPVLPTSSKKKNLCAWLAFFCCCCS